jgi:hypothetical protein
MLTASTITDTQIQELRADFARQYDEAKAGLFVMRRSTTAQNIRMTRTIQRASSRLARAAPRYSTLVSRSSAQR